VALGYWSGIGHTAVSDDSAIVFKGLYSVKAINSTDPSQNFTQAKLDFTTVPNFASGLNAQALMLLNMNFMFYWNTDGSPIMGNYPLSRQPSVTLTDSNGRQITAFFSAGSKRTGNAAQLNLGSINANGAYVPNSVYPVGTVASNGVWIGDSLFNWIIASMTFSDGLLVSSGSFVSFNVDELNFSSALPVDPTVNTALQVYDSASETLYGTRMLNVDAPELQDYMFIVPFAQSILAVTKNPIIKLKVKYGAKTWARPSQTVHVASMPCYGLSNWYGRIVDLEFDYQASTKMLHSIFTLTPRYQPVTSKEWYKGQLDGIIKNMKW
jgi:hypothetical protein